MSCVRCVPFFFPPRYCSKRCLTNKKRHRFINRWRFVLSWRLKNELRPLYLIQSLVRWPACCRSPRLTSSRYASALHCPWHRTPEHFRPPNPVGAPVQKAALHAGSIGIDIEDITDRAAFQVNVLVLSATIKASKTVLFVVSVGVLSGSCFFGRERPRRHHTVPCFGQFISVCIPGVIQLAHTGVSIEVKRLAKS